MGLLKRARFRLFLLYGWFRSPLIIITAWVTKCSFPSKLSLCGSDRLVCLVIAYAFVVESEMRTSRGEFAQALTDAIHKPQTDNHRHASREHIKGSRDDLESVARDGEYFRRSSCRTSGPATGIFFKLAPASAMLSTRPSDSGPPFSTEYEECRKYLCDHLRARIVEEAGTARERKKKIPDTMNPIDGTRWVSGRPMME